MISIKILRKSLEKRIRIDSLLGRNKIISVHHMLHEERLLIIIWGTRRGGVPVVEPVVCWLKKNRKLFKKYFVLKRACPCYPIGANLTDADMSNNRKNDGANIWEEKNNIFYFFSRTGQTVEDKRFIIRA